MLRLTALAVCCTLALGACSPKDSASNQAQTASSSATQTEGASLTVKTTRGEAKVPQNPERIAVYDLGMLDTLNKLGVKTGLSVDKNRLPYLDEYFKTTKPAGTLFEPDYEALNAYKPQLIIIGSRAAKAFDKLNEIAPTIEMTAETANLKESSKERIDALGQIFGKQAEADKLKAEIDASLKRRKLLRKAKVRVWWYWSTAVRCRLSALLPVWAVGCIKTSAFPLLMNRLKKAATASLSALNT